MKKIFILLTISFIGIMGCKVDLVNPSEASSIVTSFQGQFVNWIKGDNHRILFLGANDVWNSDKIYASSKIDSNGYFFLNNLDKPSASFLVNKAYPVYADGIQFQENSLICSDSTAKVVYGVLIIVKETSNNRVAEVYHQNFSFNFYLNEGLLKTGNFMSEYIYSDKDVSLKGKVKYIYNSTYSNRESHMTYNYNLNLKKGWNRRVTYILSYDVSANGGKTVVTAEINYVNLEPARSDWYYLYY